MAVRILLDVLYFLGWLICSTHLHHQYHYVSNNMNWTQAQSLCRQNYTDLATIENAEQLNQIVNLSLSTRSVIWIGLYSRISWIWSDGNTEAPYNTFYIGNSFSLNGSLSYYRCLKIDIYGQLYYDDCSAENVFICYNGTQLDPQLEFVNKSMNWSNAQSYCRKNFTDLANVRNQSESQKVQQLVPTGTRAWIGLNGTFKMSWSDGSSKGLLWEYLYLASLNNPVVCGLIYYPYKPLVLYNCNAMFTVICHTVISPPVVEVKRREVKLRLKVEGPSVNLNDPAVKADMMRKLQDRLQEEGVSGVTLNWREQPDGTVFHKEKTHVTHDEC